MNCLYGLSGYSIRVSLADPSMGKIVSVHYPQWAVINTTDGLQSASVTMSAVDLTKQIEAGAKSVELGSITISGVSTGSTNIIITQLKFDGDGEAGVDMGRNTVQTTQPTVTAVTSAPGTTSSMSYSGGGGGGGTSGSSSVSSGSAGSGGSVTTTMAKATTVPSGYWWSFTTSLRLSSCPGLPCGTCNRECSYNCGCTITCNTGNFGWYPRVDPVWCRYNCGPCCIRPHLPDI